MTGFRFDKRKTRLLAEMPFYLVRHGPAYLPQGKA
jgi:hypothetical protein